METNNQILEMLKKACLVAGKIQLEYYDREHSISQKEIPADLVTEVDVKSQEVIIKNITESMLEAGFEKREVGFIGEEGVHEKAKHLFIIDPIDGTNNYIERNGQFCVSIGYLVDGDLRIGVVYKPVEDVFYYALKGEGSFKLKGDLVEKLEIKKVKLADAVVAFNSSAWPEATEKVFRVALELVRKVRRIKETRSAVLTSLSIITSKFNISLNGKTKLWDIAAAKIIIEEAGGLMTDWQGNDVQLDLEDVKKSYAIIAANKDLLGEVIKIINA